jgi:hypothetical protein
VITRRDIDSGYQGVQSIHAAIQFGQQYPDIYQDWYQKSNYLGWLSVDNERELMNLVEQAKAHDISVSVFKEPDIGDRITAIALAPGQKSKKLCSRLPLALKGIQ